MEQTTSAPSSRLLRNNGGVLQRFFCLLLHELTYVIHLTGSVLHKRSFSILTVHAEASSAPAGRRSPEQQVPRSASGKIWFSLKAWNSRFPAWQPFGLTFPTAEDWKQDETCHVCCRRSSQIRPQKTSEGSLVWTDLFKVGSLRLQGLINNCTVRYTKCLITT